MKTSDFVIIAETNGKYVINKMGEVFRVCSDGSYKRLKGSSDKDGYMLVVLRVDNNKLFKKIHRLVAEAFIKNPEKKPTVNHINGDKKDNRVENLEWSTYSENNKHAYDYKLKTVDHAGSKNPRFKTGLNQTGSFEKVCELCGNSFVAKIKRYRFCSRVCSNKNNSLIGQKSR